MNETDGRIDVIKAHGRRPSEEFSTDKLHKSIVAACLSNRTPIGEAEQIGRSVCLSVISWCAERGEVTTDDLRRIAAFALTQLHPDASYLYRNHQQIV